jgi:hypothetical protein
MTQPTKTNSDSSQAHKRLSVQVSLTGLSFLVYTPDRHIHFQKKISLGRSGTPEELQETLQTCLDNWEALQHDFDKVTLLYATNVYTMVPSVLFDEKRASDYLKFNSKLLGNDYVAHEAVGKHDMVTVYIPLMNLNNYLFDRFGSFEYYHSATLLVSYLLDLHKNNNRHRAFLHIEDGFFNLVLLKHGTLQLCNSYSFQTPEDFLYYVLFTFEQLGTNPETIETFLLGEIQEGDHLYNIAYRYIRHLSFWEDESLPKELGETPQHEQFVQKLTL